MIVRVYDGEVVGNICHDLNVNWMEGAEIVEAIVVVSINAIALIYEVINLFGLIPIEIHHTVA